MGINWRQLKMKKVLLTMAVLIGLTTGVMTLSAFTTPKHDAKTECSNTKMNDDNWKKFREKVPYCDGDKDMCMGYGTVWVNTDTYQVAFEDDKTSHKYDLSEYTKKEGYNMRFWRSSDSKYYYVNIYIPASAFN